MVSCAVPLFQLLTTCSAIQALVSATFKDVLQLRVSLSTQSIPHSPRALRFQRRGPLSFLSGIRSSPRPGAGGRTGGEDRVPQPGRPVYPPPLPRRGAGRCRGVPAPLLPPRRTQRLAGARATGGRGSRAHPRGVTPAARGAAAPRCGNRPRPRAPPAAGERLQGAPVLHGSGGLAGSGGSKTCSRCPSDLESQKR